MADGILSQIAQAGKSVVPYLIPGYNTYKLGSEAVQGVQARIQQQQAAAELARQQELAKAQEQRRALLTSLGQYPVATQGGQKVYINPQTGQYQNYPAGGTAPASTASVQVDAQGRPLDQNTLRYAQENAGGGTITQQNTTLGAEIPNVQPFTYNFADETNKAYNALQEFYAKLLDFAGGRLDLAKRMLEYTYQQGIRETTQEYEQAKGELERTIPVETANLIAALNRRGVIQSGFGQEESKRLTEGQLARQQAVERAKQNRESRLTSERGFSLESAQKDYGEKQFDLERQRRQEAQQMAQQKYGIKSVEYEAELKKQEQAEGRRVQDVTTNALNKVAGTKPPEPTSPTVKVGGATGKVADSTGRLYGGWYINPSSGKSQRYWGDGYWTDN